MIKENDIFEFIDEPLSLREYEGLFISPDPDLRYKSKEVNQAKTKNSNEAEYEYLPRTKFIFDEKTGELKEEIT